MRFVTLLTIYPNLPKTSSNAHFPRVSTTEYSFLSLDPIWNSEKLEK